MKAGGSTEGTRFTALAGVAALAVVGVLIVFSLLRPTDLPPLTMGFQICNSPAENHRRFDPLVAYLSQELGREVRAVHLDTADFLEEKHQHYDIYHVNSLVYINLSEAGAASVIAGESQGSGGPNTQGWIVTRRDSGIRRLEDLAGRSLIFGPMLSPGGYLAQYYDMQRAGVDPERHLSTYTFPWGAWKHEKVVYAVYYGIADAGAARYDDLERMAADYKIDPEDFTVVSRSEWIPWCTVAVSPSLPRKVQKKIEAALFGLEPGDTARLGKERLDVLHRAEINGFVPAGDEKYAKVREMARSVGMPPFQEW